ncbi:TolC family protein [Rufibacter latericius]|uniref:TolC family protein n=1 Tax=Rufibacter latericius TaxID=2487040 RepID=A0A3M9MZT7_9BACT|nr:TolC family protein [Rufibacter latericius]RNI30655.1 TolC family protein [Rufibacter latericius]
MRRFSTKFLSTLGLVIGCHTISLAQTSSGTETVWTLQQCVDHAIKNNLQIKQSGLSVEQAVIDLKQSKTDQLPSINGSGSHSFNNGFFLDPVRNQIQNQQVWAGNLGINGSVNLYSGLQAQNTIKRNKLEYEAAQLDQQKVQNDITLNVVTVYMNVLLNQEILKTNQERLNLTKSQLERTQKLFKAGSIPESNVLELNAQIASDELNIITAQNNIELFELQLIQMLNLPDANPGNFSIEVPQIPDPDQTVIGFNAEEVFASASTRMPEILRTGLRIRSADKNIAIAKGGYHPSLSLVGSVSTRYSSGSSLFNFGNVVSQRTLVGYEDEGMSQPIYIYTPSVEQTPKDYPYFNQLQDNIGQYIGINLNVPIFNGFRVRNNVQLSRLGLRNAQINSDIAKNELKQTIAQSYTDAINAQKRFVAAKKQLEAFEQAYKNAEIRLNNGLINNVDFNVARNNLVKAQSDIIQAKYDYTFRLKFLEFYQGKTITL